ncbi:MAG: SMP-30/gluconolactonase/LRE family protein [Rectinemataceae bacterium]
MKKHVIAFDLGTGGNKASLYDEDGVCLAYSFVPYATSYPHAGWHEQRPADWWEAVVRSTRELLGSVRLEAGQIACCGISGHSLGVVPIDEDGCLLRESTPIWSDSRPDAKQTGSFFAKVDETNWYMKTGAGFPPPLYPAFKIMWYRDTEPGMFRRIHKIIGTKDYINLRLTGRIATDHSYASGTGLYDLLLGDYSEELLSAAELPRSLFPDIFPSTEVIGSITAAAAAELGLPQGLQVVAGGVDNSCMALGARAFKEGRIYNSLGSSSWIAVSSGKPLLHPRIRPYVFAHVVPGLFASATAIFSAGTSFRWLRDQACRDLVRRAEEEGLDAYELMTAEAAASPAGARDLLFNPSLGGGSSLDDSPHIRGAFMGLDLGHTRSDLIRAAMEGVAMGLRVALDELRKLAPLGEEMTVVGGGSRSALWRQILADIYDLRIVKTSVDQHAAALGAAALAAVGTGLWRNFDRIDEIHVIDTVSSPQGANRAVYDRLQKVYVMASGMHARLGQELAKKGESKMGKDDLVVELLLEAGAVCGESPIWDPEAGCVWWADTASPYVHSWDPASRTATSRDAGHTVRALALAGSGSLVILCADGIFLLESGKEAQFLCDPERGQADMLLDDGTVDSAGRFLFNTFNTAALDAKAGSIYSIDTEGKLLTLDSGLALPNGMAFSADGHILYVAEMFANRILRYDYDSASGRASRRSVFAEVPAADGMPDGLIVDAEGFVWSAHWAGWRITRYAPDGSIDRVIPMPFATATCMGFGGPKLEDLYVTSATMGLSPEDLQRSRSPGGLFVIQNAGRGIKEGVFGKKR